MTRVVQFMRDLVAKGMSWEDAAMFAERFETDLKTAVDEAVALVKPIRSPAAARQANYRDRQRNAGITPVTQQRDVTPLSEGSQGSLSPEPPNLPNPPNLSQEPPIVPQIKARKAKLGPAKGAFPKFWEAYPLKVGKLAAERAFAKAWDRCETDDQLAEMLAGLERCKAVWDPEFIPHPTTWLNQGRWMDVPTPDLPDSTGPPRFDLAKFEAERAALTKQLEDEERAA